MALTPEQRQEIESFQDENDDLDVAELQQLMTEKFGAAVMAEYAGEWLTALAPETAVQVASCNTCRHLQRAPGKPAFCAAYPRGLPMWFASGDVPHDSLVGDEEDPIFYEPANLNGLTP